MHWLTWSRRRNEASCHEVARVLQMFLDGELEERASRRVHRHLERCRRCGMEAATYQAIKDALSRSGEPLDDGALTRVKEFGVRLAEEGLE